MTVYRDNIREVFTKTANEDMTGKDGYFVKEAENGRYDLCDTAGERADGVVIKGRGEGKSIQVVKLPGGVGKVKIVPGGITNGVEVATDNMGRARVATAGNYVLGLARQTVAASTEGGEGSVDLVLYQKN